MLRIYIGMSGSGKDTFLKRDIKNGYKPIISYTTRPKRDGEVDGVDYNYVSFEVFKNLYDSGKIIEYRSYNTTVEGISDVWYYGTPGLDSIATENYVAILDINGANSFIDKYGPEYIEIIYLYVDNDIRKERAKKRGSFDETEWNRRLKSDLIVFSENNLCELAANLGKVITLINNNISIPIL